MAALVRNSGLFRLKNAIPRIPREIRLISTSKKNSETATVTTTTPVEPIPDFSKPDPKNWQSYGFSFTDKEEDRNVTNSSFFFSITLCFIFGGVGWAYFPDIGLKNWASREAYIELRRREANGLPLVDRNYIDPSLMVLPSEEELGDTEIII